jgi:hypothetical protein
MDKRKIKFKFIREGLNKFSIIKLPQESNKLLHRNNYVFIDTNGKSCKSGFIIAYFEDFDSGTRYVGRYVGSVLRYEKVMHDIYYFVGDTSRVSSWYLLYYNFNHRDVDKTDLDIVWCFSKYRGKEEGETYDMEILDGLWKDMRQATRQYKIKRYASRIQHYERYRR